MGTVSAINSASFIPAAASYRGVDSLTALASYEQILSLQSQSTSLTGQTSSTDSNDVLLSADLLDLSPAALNLLNGLNSISDTSSVLSVPGGVGTLNTAQLTTTQQQQVTQIVSQFVSQPLTQATFTQIQTALQAAGINPQQISLQQLLGAYAYAYVPGYSLEGQPFTDVNA